MNHRNNEKDAILFSGGGRFDIEAVKQLIQDSQTSGPYRKAVYIGAANGDREAAFESARDVLIYAGLEEVVFLKLAGEDVDTSKVEEMLKAADVIFISGGEVEDGMKWLTKHNLCEYIRQMYFAGKQFLCVSAGTIMMGRYWVNMDEQGEGRNPYLFDCLNLIPEVFDTHAEEEDWRELKTALRLMGKNSVGYGIPTLGLITADSSGRLTGYNTRLLQFRYNGDGSYTVSAKRGIQQTNG